MMSKLEEDLQDEVNNQEQSNHSDIFHSFKRKPRKGQTCNLDNISFKAYKGSDLIQSNN